MEIGFLRLMPKLTFYKIYLVLILILNIFISINTSIALECRGEVADDSFEWNAQNFAGFYYDIDKDVSTERLSTIVTSIGGEKSFSGDRPYGIQYKTVTTLKGFEFEDWGSYYVIGYLGKKYFAGYADMTGDKINLFYSKSRDENSLLNEQLQEVLIDDNISQLSLMADQFLDLKDGYKIIITDIDISGEKLIIRLVDKNYNILKDNYIIIPSSDPSRVEESTFYYTTNVGTQRDLVIIAVHFYGVFLSHNGQPYGIIDGMWQISDKPIDIKNIGILGKMSQDLGDNNIVINNKKYSANINKRKNIPLMDDFYIKVADGEYLRYYVYKEYTKPGNYEIRSTTADNNFTWDWKNFAGFYYDINKNIGTETIYARVSVGEINQKYLSGDKPYGLIYETQAQCKDFEFNKWGCYYVIGFLGMQCFAGYAENVDQAKDSLYSKSTHSNSFMFGQLQEVLIDDNTERVFNIGETIRLLRGYELLIKETDGNKIRLILKHNNNLVHEGIVYPSDDDTKIDESTFYYKRNIGELEDLVIVAVHFKNVLESGDNDVTTVDGIWQLSDESFLVNTGTTYDKMTVTHIGDPMKIIMSNENKNISLSKNKTRRIIYQPGMDYLKSDDESIMGDIWIRTADSDILRYYLYSAKTIDDTYSPEKPPTTPVIEPVPIPEPMPDPGPVPEPIGEGRPWTKNISSIGFLIGFIAALITIGGAGWPKIKKLISRTKPQRSKGVDQLHGHDRDPDRRSGNDKLPPSDERELDDDRHTHGQGRDGPR